MGYNITLRNIAESSNVKVLFGIDLTILLLPYDRHGSSVISYDVPLTKL